MRKPNPSLLIGIMLTVLSCVERTPDITLEIVEEPEDVFEKVEKDVTTALLVNPMHAEDMDELKPSYKHLFGIFFCGQAEFFVIENPTQTLHTAPINMVTHAYIKDKLGQSRYMLDSDIANQLINRYGTFKITGYNPQNADLIKSGDILITENTRQRINPDLDNYLLKWTFEEVEIRYRVNVNNPVEPFQYTERRLEYREELRSAERNCTRFSAS